MDKYHYIHLVCGGTFDHLHQGHKHFLQTAFLRAKKVTIGLTNYSAYQKPYAGSIQTYRQRLQTLSNYLIAKGYNYHSRIVPIFDPFGPSIQNQNYNLILVTNQTKEGAERINFKRKMLGLKNLKILNCDFLPHHSSSSIRQGIDLWQGRSLLTGGTLYLHPEKREYFRAPLGKLLSSPRSLAWPALQAKKLIKKSQPPLVAVVGDIATHSFINEQVPFQLAVVDYRTRREPMGGPIHRRLNKQAKWSTSVINRPGTISSALVKQTACALNQPGKRIVKVIGEEDLAVVPLILLSPLNSLIFYGQPYQGLVAVRVTLAKKQKCWQLLKYFSY